MGHELVQERRGDLGEAKQVFHEQQPAAGRGKEAQRQAAVHRADGGPWGRLLAARAPRDGAHIGSYCRSLVLRLPRSPPL